MSKTRFPSVSAVLLVSLLICLGGLSARRSEAQTNTPTPTIVPPTGSPMPGGGGLLLPTNTPYTSNSTCPNYAFPTDRLDPKWAAVCSACLPQAATSTSFFQAAGTLGIPTWSPPTNGFVTWTPTAANTSMPTITSTPSPTPVGGCTWSHTFDFTSGWHDWYPLVNVYGTYGTQTGTGIRSSFFPSPAFNNVQAIHIHLDDIGGAYMTQITIVEEGANSSCGRLVYWAKNGEGSSQTAVTGPDEASYTWAINTAINTLVVGTQDQCTSSTDYNYVRSVTLMGTGTNPFTGINVCGTPTPTAVPATSTPVFTPTGTYDGAQIMRLADCTTPVYRPGDFDPPVADVEVEYESTACYILVPQLVIDTSAVEGTLQILTGQTVDLPDFKIEGVILCLDFYMVNASLLGVAIPLDAVVFLLIAVAILRIIQGNN